MQIETRYARNGDATIAWTAAGDAPTDLLFVPGFVSHVEHLWEQPGLAGFFERLMGFTRLLVMDRRGCGLSDPRPAGLSLEDEARDVLAVLDAAGSERAVLMGYTTGGLLTIATATMAPERVQAIVLYASMARTLANDDVDWTFDADGRRAMWAQLAEVWGTGANLEQLAPSRADDTRMKAWLARMERLSSSPGELLRLMNSTGDHDISHLLGELRVPALILHRTGDRMIDVRHSRYLAERIPGARYVELEGVDNLPGAVDSSDMLGEIEEFLTGGRSRTVARDLLTIVFSDIVGSTGHAARLGDARWRDLLGAHQTAVRREIDRFGGREVKTIGDAFLIAFDGAPSQRRPLRGGHRRGRPLGGPGGPRRAAHRRVRGHRPRRRRHGRPHRRARRRAGGAGRGAGLGYDVRHGRGGGAEVRGARHAGAQRRAGALAAVRARLRLIVCVQTARRPQPSRWVPCWGA